MKRFNLILPIGLSLIVHMGVFVLAAAYYGAGPLGGGGGGGYPSTVTVSIVSLPGPGTGWDGREAVKTNIPARGIKKSLARKAVKRPQDKGKKVRREKFAGRGMDKAPPLENKKVVEVADPAIIETGEVALTRKEKEKTVKAARAEISKRDIKGQETGEAQESPLEHGLDINSMPPPPAPYDAAPAAPAGPVIVSPVFASTGSGIDGAQGEGGPGGDGVTGLHLPEGGGGGPSAGLKGGTGMGLGSGNSIEIIGLNTPRYPRYSRIRGEEGTVVIEINLKGDGSPGRVVIARSSGYARLDHAALKAAREAEFVIPGGERGRAMLSKRIAFTFKLKDGDARQ